jgi:hypothetical protein
MVKIATLERTVEGEQEKLIGDILEWNEGIIEEKAKGADYPHYNVELNLTENGMKFKLTYESDHVSAQQLADRFSMYVECLEQEGLQE